MGDCGDFADIYLAFYPALERTLTEGLNNKAHLVELGSEIIAQEVAKLLRTSTVFPRRYFRFDRSA